MTLNTPRRRTAIRVGAAASVIGGVLTAASAITHFHGIIRPLVPIGVACLGIGMLGLQAVITPREAALRRFGWSLTGVGISLGVIGMGGSAMGIVGTATARVINTGEHAGLPFIGAGMIAWGYASVRSRALGRWSAVPLFVGAPALAGIAMLNAAALAYLERTPVLPSVFGASWIALGLALFAAARKLGLPSLNVVTL
jgi:hypothetical protein